MVNRFGKLMIIGAAMQMNSASIITAESAPLMMTQSVCIAGGTGVFFISALITWWIKSQYIESGRLEWKKFHKDCGDGSKYSSIRDIDEVRLESLVEKSKKLKNVTKAIYWLDDIRTVGTIVSIFILCMSAWRCMRSMDHMNFPIDAQSPLYQNITGGILIAIFPVGLLIYDIAHRIIHGRPDNLFTKDNLRILGTHMLLDKPDSYCWKYD